jgi:hypothetical protein
MSKKWTQKEKNIIKKYYRTKEKEKLTELLPNRSWNAIALYAQKLKIKRSLDFYRATNVGKLLEETPEAYYWIGFLLADGHFSEKRITVELSIKDIKHIRKFAKFISASCSKGHSKCGGKYYGNCYVKVANSDVVPLLREKFEIYNNKTYRPCNIIKINDEDLLFSLIIGFIDGDGSIRKQSGRQDCQMTIKCCYGWLSNLQFISDTICQYCDLEPNTSKINKYGYAEVSFTNSIILKFLKAKGKELNLPVLKRKWDRIDENYVSKFEKYKDVLKEVKILIQEGLKVCDISQIVDRSPASIYQMIRKHNLRKI